MSNEAFIIGAVRSPTGKKKGTLAGIHAADLGAHAIKALIERTGVDPGAVDDVIFGCVDQLGSQAGDIARTCWLVAGFPDHVPGTTVDRQCGSSQQAVHFAAQAVMSGTQDLVVAGGVQTMNQIPIGAAMVAGRELGMPDPFSGSPGWGARGLILGKSVERGDLARGVALLDRRERAAVALERELLHRLAAQVPLRGDHLR